MNLYIFTIFLLFLTHHELLPASGQTEGCGGFQLGWKGEVKYETQESSSEICIWLLQGWNTSKIEVVVDELTGSEKAVGIHWNVDKPAEYVESLILDSSNVGQIEEINSEIVAIVLHRTGRVALSFSWESLGDEEEKEGQLWSFIEDPTEPNPGEGKFTVKPIAATTVFHISKWQQGPLDYAIDFGWPQHCPDSNKCECLGGAVFQAKEDGGLEKLFSLCNPIIGSSVSSVRGPLLAFAHAAGNSTDSDLTLAWNKRRPEEATTTDNSLESTTHSAAFNLEANNIMLMTVIMAAVASMFSY